MQLRQENAILNKVSTGRLNEQSVKVWSKGLHFLFKFCIMPIATKGNFLEEY